MSVFSREELQLISNLIELFIKSSEEDPYLRELTGGRVSHSDGWGMAALMVRGREVEGLYYRMGTPIYAKESKELIKMFIGLLSAYETVYMLLHSRAASRNQPLGKEHAHPYMENLSCGTLWFAHNGTLRKEELLGKVREERITLLTHEFTDSALASKYLAHVIENKVCKDSEELLKVVKDVYTELRKYVIKKSALNTGLLMAIKFKPILIASYVVGEEVRLSKLRSDYYRLYSIEVLRESGRSVIIISSSTLVDYYLKGIKELRVSPIESEGLIIIEDLQSIKFVPL